MLIPPPWADHNKDCIHLVPGLSWVHLVLWLHAPEGLHFSEGLTRLRPGLEQSQSSGSEHFSWGGTTSECPGELSVRPSVYCGLSEFPGPLNLHILLYLSYSSNSSLCCAYLLSHVRLFATP